MRKACQEKSVMSVWWSCGNFPCYLTEWMTIARHVRLFEEYTRITRPGETSSSHFDSDGRWIDQWLDRAPVYERRNNGRGSGNWDRRTICNETKKLRTKDSCDSITAIIRTVLIILQRTIKHRKRRMLQKQCYECNAMSHVLQFSGKNPP